MEAVLNHLRTFRSQLENRATEQAWYELQQPQEKFTASYAQPKIIFPDIASDLRFAYDSKGAFFSNTAYCIANDSHYLLGILNSAVVRYFYVYLSAQIRGGYLRFWTQYVEQIPIPAAPQSERTAIERLPQSGLMESVLVLQGRAIASDKLRQVQKLVASHPQWSRYRLSRELCALWQWRAPNGQLKDMAARTLLLKLAERGHLDLPAKRRLSPNRMLHKQLRPVSHECQPIADPLAALRPLAVTELSQRPEGLARHGCEERVGRG